MNFLSKLRKIDKINFITIDGISCSGKSSCAKFIKKKQQAYFNDILIISKDLFLYPRSKRILITKKTNSLKLNQNNLHYDLKKLNYVLNFLCGKTNEKKIFLKNLYNRKNGKNDLRISIIFKKNRLIIFEGIFVNEDLRTIKNPIIKILLVEKIYNSLQRKIERIRDKKISIQLVVTEFIKIHLSSFKYYLEKYQFDLCYDYNRSSLKKIQKGQFYQLKLIDEFIKKHNF